MAAPCGAAPISPDDSATRTEQIPSAIAVLPEPSAPRAVQRPAPPPAVAIHDRLRPGAVPSAGAPEPLEAGTDARATVPERHGTATPVEENPSVDVLDVVKSVIESALGSTPWLHVGSHRPVERARRVDGGSLGEASTESTSRIDDGAYAESARVASAGTTEIARSSAASQSNPIRDAVQLIRELIIHPIAWVIGVLALLASITLAVVKGYGKRSP